MTVVLDDGALEALAAGCAILGTGGGGDVWSGLLMARQAIGDHGPVRVVTLDDLPDDGLVLPIAGMGAPTVGIEKLPNGGEALRLRDEVERHFGQPVCAVMSSEIGGANGLEPVAWAAMLGLPLIDADSMGRAFPEVHQVAQNVAGRLPDLTFLCDERGNVVTIRARDGAWAERLARTATVAMGGSAVVVDCVLTVAETRGAVIDRTVSLAVAIGRAVLDADDPLAALVAAVDGHLLVTGKIADVERRTTGGFARGHALVDGTGADRGRTLCIEIQNENLVAREDRRLLASVPDLISIVDATTARAIQTESLRYGQRIAVVAYPSHPLWRTPRGVELAGPRAFGYDFDFVPVEVLAQ